MLRDDELPPLPKFFAKHICAEAERTLYDEAAVREYARAVERAAYERAAAHVRTLKRDQWYLRVAPEIVVEECAVAIEKLMMQEQPR